MMKQLKEKEYKIRIRRLCSDRSPIAIISIACLWKPRIASGSITSSINVDSVGEEKLQNPYASSGSEETIKELKEIPNPGGYYTAEKANSASSSQSESSESASSVISISFVALESDALEESNHTLGSLRGFSELPALRKPCNPTLSL
jgi:hypothetical protein